MKIARNTGKGLLCVPSFVPMNEFPSAGNATKSLQKQQVGR